MADDNLGKYKDDGREGWHTDYVVINRYCADPAVVMLGVASPQGFAGQNAAFVQLAAETLTWVADWTACRQGSRPTVPDPTPQNSDWVLLMKTPELHSLGLAADGVTPVYRISGSYVYGKRRTDTDTYSQVEFPVGPWMDKVDPTGVSSDLLEKGILDGTTAGGTHAQDEKKLTYSIAGG